MILTFFLRYWYFFALGVCAFVIFLYDHQLSRANEQKRTLFEDKIIATQSIERFKDDFNREHAKVQVLETSKEGLQILIKGKDEYINQLIKDYNIKPKNLEAATQSETTSYGEFETYFEDSTDNYKVTNYKEQWFEMSATIRGDTMKFRPLFYNKQDIILHRERRKRKHFFDLFRPKILTAEVINHNPYSSTTGLKAIFHR